MKKRISIIALIASLSLGACSTKPAVPTDPAYVKEIDAWHAYRLQVLKSPTGWLNIAGLFWLKEGINSFGSAADNDLLFPAVSEVKNYGYFLLDKGMVKQVLLPGVQVMSSGKLVADTQVVFHPDSTRQPILESGSLRWFVIKRDTKCGIRLRDLNHPNLSSFGGIERYPVDAAWKVTAQWEETPGRTIAITNVLGQTTPQSAPGTLVFSLNGREYRLDALDEGDPDRLFIIFGDATNAKETYGAGRYLYVPRPDSLGQVPVDFNKAENPPCAFTEFATCPLPPIQNVMDMEVRAGEKDYKHP